jgi:replication factor A1
LDPKLLVEAFIEAWNNKTSNLGTLKITSREINPNSASFLITKAEKVISQFPITTEILKKPDYIKEQLQYFSSSHYEPKKPNQKQMKISELSYRMRGINVKAKIIEIPSTQQVQTRFGTTASLYNVKITDETGSIRLGLWNEQINNIHVGDKVELKNCYIDGYRGELQLRLGRRGRLSIVDTEDARNTP